METAHLPNGTLLQGGRYKIVRFIGSGGFGCTYEGEHTMLGKKVAVKEFFVKDFCDRDETSSHVTSGTIGKRELVEKLRGKFVEEARATSLMQHPNIIKVSDVFEENETAYYVMDYIEGPSLDKIVKEQGSLPEQTAVKYIRQVADALAYVHSLNRLHLDLKPANIMTDGHGNAILVDFGASKQYDEAGGENTSTLIGKTPGYAPIEQMGNTVTTFTPATDIYALGATLYKLLTGTTPLEATMLASGEELAPLPPNISESTANAVHAAMQVAKSKRPQSIAEFLSLLEVPAGKPSTGVGTPATPTPPAPVAPNTVEDETIIDSVPKKGEPQHSSQPQPNPEPDPSDKPKSKKGWRIAAMIVSAVIVIAGIVLFFALRTPSIKMVSVTGQFNGHDYVDLGLSVKWATCNVGASYPSDFGNYYAWGETATKSEYTLDNSVSYGKAIGNIAGNPQYDAATANWGDAWRLPTENETNELRTKCKWKWGKMDGHKGFKVTGPNGNSIFLPAAGQRYGAYLYYSGAASFYLGDGQIKKEEGNEGIFPLDASLLLGFREGESKAFSWNYNRHLGQSVRPVLGKTSTQTPSSSSATNNTSSTASSSGNATSQQGSNQTTAQATSTSSKPADLPNHLNGHEYVDLGLSVMWATCNVGASSPSDYGNYYAWGETKPKSDYSIQTSIAYSANIENIVGNAKYDAARANWGGTWRLPTINEIDELIGECKWEWGVRDGHNGYKVTGSNGKSIFLPAAGLRSGPSLSGDGTEGQYMSATYEGQRFASGLLFRSNSLTGSGFSILYVLGKTVRPVISKSANNSNSSKQTTPSKGYINNHEYVDLGLSVKWATCNIGAASPSDYGDYYAWGETKTKNVYTSDNWVINQMKKGNIAGDPQYDAARTNWGGTWRLPRGSEIDELIKECTWEWVSLDGKNGYNITGKNGNSIFLPAAGSRDGTSFQYVGTNGFYWSATQSEMGMGYSYSLCLYNSSYKYEQSSYPYVGFSIRPVSN